MASNGQAKRSGLLMSSVLVVFCRACSQRREVHQSWPCQSLPICRQGQAAVTARSSWDHVASNAYRDVTNLHHA